MKKFSVKQPLMFSGHFSVMFIFLSDFKMLLLHLRILVVFPLCCTSACAHTTLVAACWELDIPEDGHVDGQNPKAHRGKCQHAVTAGVRVGRPERDDLWGYLQAISFFNPFTVSFSLQSLCLHSARWGMETGETVATDAVFCTLEEWERTGKWGSCYPAGWVTAGVRIFFPFCILTHLLHCFSVDQSPETNYCT